jgi:2'-5' RNA ligase
MVIKTADHWKIHGGWTPGRRYLTTFIVFEEDSPCAHAALKVQADLAKAPVAICPPDALHQTVQGAGWEDELSFAQVEKVRKCVKSAALRVAPFTLAVKSLHYEEDAIMFLFESSAALLDLRAELHKSVSYALDRCAPGEPDEIVPHMSVAYCNSESDAAPLFEAEEKYASLTVKPYEVKSVDLIWLSREADRYRWELVERCELDTD